MPVLARLKRPVGISVATVVAACALAGCAVQENPYTSEWEGVGVAQRVEANADNDALPVVMTDEVGVSFQRTPTDTLEDGNNLTMYPDELNNFNTRFLDADNRGCYACHDDLAETCNDMGYGHTDLTNNYGILPSVQMCIDCHTIAHGYVPQDQDFGSIMHTIHADERSVTCWSCHFATEDGNEMQLWDEVKYDRLRGINEVENVQGEFSFTQDSVRHRADGDRLSDLIATKWAGWCDYGSEPGELDSITNHSAETDQKTFDEWTITISGAVGQEMTWTLPELIAQAPNEDVVLKMSCDYNPIGGPYITNAEVRGIPLSWLFEQAGASADAYGFTAVSSYLANSEDFYFEFSSILEGNEDDEAYIVYQLDGTELTYPEGYPVALWVGGFSSAGVCTKQLSDLIVYEKDDFEAMMDEMGPGYNGWQTYEGDAGLEAGREAGLSPAEMWDAEQQGWYVSKPNAGLFNNREGRIITLGESYTFEGYADSFNNEITAIEFSMDGGKTWTSYATEGATDDRWVNWKFTYTPEEEGAYVLHLRSRNINGLVTPEPQEFMFNVKAEGE